MRNKLTIGAFLLMLMAFVVILALPADEESIKSENRVMSTVPPFCSETVFSGEFETGFENFIGDNIGFRSKLTGFSKTLDEKKGFVPKTGKIISTNKDIGTGTTQKQTLLVADNTIMEMFIRNSETEHQYADAINRYAEKLPQNIKLFSMVIPTQLEFREPIYKNLQDSQKDTIDSIYSKLDGRVNTVDAYSLLFEHSNEYIFFRTDHHWTQLGAYYGYNAFMNTEGGQPVSKDDYETGKIQGVLGYLYDRVTSDVATEPDTIEWYDINYDEHIKTTMYAIDEQGEMYSYNGIMYDRSKANYNFFFGSDHPIVEMTNEKNTDGKTIVVLKDSYTNVFAPWLIESYKNVILVDPRIFSGDFQMVLDKYSPDEVLVVNYIFTTVFADYCNLLGNLY